MRSSGGVDIRDLMSFTISTRFYERYIEMLPFLE